MLEPNPETGQESTPPRQREFAPIAGYEIEREIGRGGMATVYRAIQQSLGRPVAIKILAHAFSEDSEFAQRFKKEGRVLAQLLHPNIVTVHDIRTTEDNRLFLSIEYLSGGTLKERIKQGLSLDFTLSVARAIAKALEYAHEKGVIHRDVKPSNIMFRQDGTPVLTDFGVARVTGWNTVHTATGLMVGSPGYMSPEQAMGKSATIQSDLYGLGVVLYEMLTGHPLYEADNPISVMLQHVHDPVPKLPEEHVRFQPILNRLLAKQAHDRYKNAGEFLEALDLIAPSDAGTHPRLIASDSLSVMEFASGKFQSLLKRKSRLSIWISAGITLLLIVFILVSQQNTVENTGIKPEPVRLVEQAPSLQEEQKQREQQQQAQLQAEQLLINAQSSAEEGLLEVSLAHIEQGLLAVPNHPNLLALREQVKMRMVERQQKKEAQQQEEEVRRQKAEAEQQRQTEIRQRQEQEAKRQTEIAERQKAEQARRQAEAERRREEADQYAARALDYQKRGQYSISLQQIEKGLEVIPNHVGLLSLREKVRAEWSAEQQRQKAQHRSAIKEEKGKETARRQTRTPAISKEDNDAALKKIQRIKSAVDALDHSLGE